ncbi:hypothetical protein ACOW7T_27795, partial [Escherichia coli]|nr:hypothetical protein [Escherichia coli]MCS0981031.1 hypothetical protein [Escherichia coli]
HQPNRRLRLAAEPQTGRREVSALTDARKTLAYDFFRILRAPLTLHFTVKYACFFWGYFAESYHGKKNRPMKPWLMWKQMLMLTPKNITELAG